MYRKSTIYPWISLVYPSNMQLQEKVCNFLFSKFDLIFTKIDNLPKQIAWQMCIFADLFRRFSRAVQCCDILQMLEVTTLDEISTCNHTVSQHLELIKPVSLWLFFAVKYRMHPSCRIPCTHRCPYLESFTYPAFIMQHMISR